MRKTGVLATTKLSIYYSFVLLARSPLAPLKMRLASLRFARRRCLDYVEALIAHVASRSCIVAFQVENEPLDKAGEKRQIVGIDFVAEEANLVRKIDTNLRPIIISAWCWSFKHDFDVKDALRYGNILGLDVYSKVRGDDTTGVERAGKLPKHYKELANAKGREAWITELQAESWNPSTFDPDDMKSLLKKVSDVSSSLATHSHIRTFATLILAQSGGLHQRISVGIREVVRCQNQQGR